MCPDNLLAFFFFYSKVKPIIYLNFKNQKYNEKTANWLCQVKMPENWDFFFFLEMADELFSLNTQAGTKNSHELWVKMKRSKTSFGWAGEMGY